MINHFPQTEAISKYLIHTHSITNALSPFAILCAFFNSKKMGNVTKHNFTEPYKKPYS